MLKLTVGILSFALATTTGIVLSGSSPTAGETACPCAECKCDKDCDCPITGSCDCSSGCCEDGCKS
ncbi:hypothetical protein V22_29690 [Calycomorphotria hydatis]|uniref:Metallothionein n=1 Tax=Calycomorphotria hydatis TaxID=2528027 RepID=A0A517TBG0_9PLAN|nr:hypothetical protein V22_29690 [Calycomorphotria hydatis]